MPVFYYKAAFPNGEMNEGQMQAADQHAVVSQLQSAGQIIIRVEEVGANRPDKLSSARFSSRIIRHEELASFTLELSTLLEAGMPLDRALRILTDVAVRDEVKHVLDALYQDVRGGAFLSDALAARNGIFTNFYINMIRAGEAGGVLGVTLKQLVASLEHAQQVRESVISKLIYPLILIMVAGSSVVLLLGYVVPQFSDLFADAGADLPWLTSWVLGIGNMLADYGWVLVILFIVAALVFRNQYNTSQGRLSWDRRWLKIPLLGDLLSKLDTSRFCHTLATLLANGVPLLQAATIAREVITNRAIMTELQNVLPALESGQGLVRPLAESAVFPELALQLIRVGEESGELEGMLYRVADIYEREVQTILNRLLTLLEPALILGLGLLIGGIIMSVLMAILDINNLVF